MSSSSKDKGDRAERDVVDYIKPYCPNIRRGKAGAEKDLGDLFNYVDLDGDPWTIQIADRAWRSTSEIEAKVATAAVAVMGRLEAPEGGQELHDALSGAPVPPRSIP